MIMGRLDDAHKNRQTMMWYLHAYVHADVPSVLPLGEAALDGLQFGGRRNCGYRLARLIDTQVIHLETPDYCGTPAVFDTAC